MFVPLLLSTFLIAESHSPILEERLSLPDIANAAAGELPAGKWRVEYASGVTEACMVNKEGWAIVTEPVRIVGRAAVSGNSILLLFENGRAQRWTPVGKRFVVEHWFPGDKFPTMAASTLGIAEPVQ